jgi:hypothetical protein
MMQETQNPPKTCPTCGAELEPFRLVRPNSFKHRASGVQCPQGHCGFITARQGESCGTCLRFNGCLRDPKMYSPACDEHMKAGTHKCGTCILFDGCINPAAEDTPACQYHFDPAQVPPVTLNLDGKLITGVAVWQTVVDNSALLCGMCRFPSTCKTCPGHYTKEIAKAMVARGQAH